MLRGVRTDGLDSAAVRVVEVGLCSSLLEDGERVNESFAWKSGDQSGSWTTIARSQPAGPTMMLVESAIRLREVPVAREGVGYG